MNSRLPGWAFLLCTACVTPPFPDAGRAGPASGSGRDAGRNMPAVAAEVLRAADRARAAEGMVTLAVDAALNQAAQAHAEELASRRTLDHTSTTPGRTTMADRIRAAGGTWVRAAENLASTTGTAGTVPAQAIRLWLSSPGHRRNLLEPAYTHTGAGVAVDGAGLWYIVQLYTVPGRGREPASPPPDH